ncbi:MAG: MnhB domain-containing protein [Desulfitobacteriaceae bacterium]|jgi:multicomponent Na+:H+ antiporter subunit B|nr:MnhB domain-containing protein [Desulfitobacteriaceae bacterium]MDD4665898.1 MnhB domain-containing protein [Clostridia bacterium]
MNERFGTVVLDTAFRFVIPFVMLYGVYVLINGESSPGGGFQAGALLAIAVVLSRLVQGEKAVFNISGNTALILAGIGTFLYGFVGVLTLCWGGNFLEYGISPWAMLAAEKHALGILGIEIGVTLCVMATIIAIFDALTRKEEV